MKNQEEKKPVKKVCPECQKVLWGLTENQADHQLKQHQLTHDKNIKEVKK